MASRIDMTLTGRDGESFEATSWMPDGDPTTVVQIMHGASEHLERYARLADALTDAGYGVYAHDHRGHGRTADRHGRFGVARPGGWTAMIDDASVVTDLIHENHPEARIVLFGHSMGSFVAQGYMERWGNGLSGVVLSGSSHGLEGSDELLPPPDSIADPHPDSPSELFAAMFAGFNEPFTSDDATGFEWLSCDPAEVKKYVDDPWCGAGVPLTNGFVADMIHGMVDAWDPEAEAKIPTNVPVLVMSGLQDPVGGFGEGASALATNLAALGVERVTANMYPDGRHEMLNETNRDEVTADLIRWLGNIAG